ncbi:hypothetical protein HAX54_013140 [Datura stramonium]|uniref:Uncharacterized protein n=1 Tax=Datura stramonium TaxID=4076 RepID=A0ABS8TML9_DATST|nr:hypothetical protein [Datura stramonium]
MQSRPEINKTQLRVLPVATDKSFQTCNFLSQFRWSSLESRTQGHTACYRSAALGRVAWAGPRRPCSSPHPHALGHNPEISGPFRSRALHAWRAPLGRVLRRISLHATDAGQESRQDANASCSRACRRPCQRVCPLAARVIARAMHHSCLPCPRLSAESSHRRLPRPHIAKSSQACLARPALDRAIA